MEQLRTERSPGEAPPARPEFRAGRGSAETTPNRWSFADEAILKQFYDVARQFVPGQKSYTELAAIVANQSACLGLWILPPADSSPPAPQSLLAASDDGLWSLVQGPVQSLVTQVATTGNVTSLTLSQPAILHVVAAPISEEGSIVGPSGLATIVGCFEGDQQSPVRLQWLLGLAAWSIRLANHLLYESQLQAGLRSQQRSLALLAEMDDATSLDAAARILANRLSDQTHADQVVVATGDTPRQTRLRAISGVEQIQPNSSGSRCCLAACQQIIRHRRPLKWEVGVSPADSMELVLDNYCREFHWAGCLAIPFSQSTPAGGCLLVALPANSISDEIQLMELKQLASLAGKHGRALVQRHQGIRQKLRQSLQKVSQRQLLLAAGLGLALALIVAWIPVPYRIACEGQLEPVTRRFVAAPFDGVLEASFVKAGDTVSPGQPLAQLDGRQLRLERSSLEAEYDNAKKRRDAALASRQVAQSQLASSEMLRYQASLGLVQDRLDHLQVCAPVGGMVVSGDLEKAKGAPLETGQTLFEIAPLEKMVAEIRIPETEISYVREGLPIAIKLDALPFETWSGTIQRIHPQAEIIDGNSVFVAEVELDNPDGQLHPGMQISSKIQGPPATLGWIVAHRPWEAIRYWWAW